MNVYELTDIVRDYRDDANGVGRPGLRLERLCLEAGAITGVAGPNGSGKSTLMRLLAFLEPPDTGEVRFLGRVAAADGAFCPETAADAEGANGPCADPEVRGRVAALRRAATLLTQEPYLLTRRVAANVAYGLECRGFSRAEIRERVAWALELVGLDPEDFGPRRSTQLSGGETQRVALAMRLALKPEVLLLDEPTASLDEDSAERVMRAAFQARDLWGATLVVVSHDRAWLDAACDRLVFLDKGRLADSTPQAYGCQTP